MMNRSKIRVSILSRLGFALLVCLALGACASSPPADDADNLTLGQVQSRITKGMGAAEVAEALGSPNIVTTDAEGREVWIYDKISTESQASESGFWGGLILFGGSRSRSQSSKTQKTLTVVIKFDESKRVRDFDYNYSKF
jgi:outer membrane protein assembly factor BamE (lipoprotein component of BamABCDE complex)